MARALRGIDPEQTSPSKPKVLIYGKPGVGKTWASLEFPSVYYIDTEGGADLQHYTQKLKQSGAKYFGPKDGSQDFETVIEEIITLATIEHPYKTLVIDSFSKLYNTKAADAAEKGGDDFGRDKKEANKPTRKLIRWLSKLDMNVILICHEKDKWTGGELQGQTFDGFDKLEYELHLSLQIQKRGEGANAQRIALVKKSRLLGFPDGAIFDWSYAEFSKRYGRDIMESNAVAIELATPEQIIKLRGLIEVLNVSQDDVQKMLDKAEAEKWEEVARGQMDIWIDKLMQRVSKLQLV